MSDSDDFLTRWSRRKRKAAKALPIEDEAQVAADAELRETATVPKVSPELPERTKKDEAKNPPATIDPRPEQPAFDISKLPSVDSITAETDIRVFLSAGVPPALRRAALRRAWSADPKIRDFIEVAENQWDFNSGVFPEFDHGLPTGDIKRMVADIFGERYESGEENEQKLAEGSEADQVEGTESASIPSGQSDDVHRNVTPATESLGDRPEPTVHASRDSGEPPKQSFPNKDASDAASQNYAATQDEEFRPARRRSHGRAMPK